MPITRRELFRSLGGLYAWAALPELTGCADDRAGAAPQGVGSDGSEHAFLHGVASGDPLPDAVMLWTRVTPRAGADRVAVDWEVASDLDFGEIVASGQLETSAERDFTVKVDADGLEAGSIYYYRFSAGEVVSPIGRTRTAVSGTADRLRFAVVSCSSYAHGYFHAYRSISERLDLDAVIHLGDYIYEYGTGEYGKVRAYEPSHEILSLSDYRQRYAQYRRDPDLQLAHQQLPWITVWDDHEIANNTWTDGAENHNPGEGDFAARKAAAQQAYAEWMPIREPEEGRVFRRFGFGDLADLIMLDTRDWGRQEQVMSDDDPALSDPERTLLGHDQEAWLAQQLTASSAQWRLIGQQIMLGRFPIGSAPDMWAGYPAARKRMLDQLRAAGDSVVLTGDVHSSWAMNVIDEPFDPNQYDPETGEGSIAVEFVTPGVTSPLFEKASGEPLQAQYLGEPHIEYVQLWRRGYMVLDVDRERVQAAWYHYDAVEDPDPVEPTFAAAAAAYSGERRVRMEANAAPAREPFADAAPARA